MGIVALFTYSKTGSTTTVNFCPKPELVTSLTWFSVSDHLQLQHNSLSQTTCSIIFCLRPLAAWFSSPIPDCNSARRAYFTSDTCEKSTTLTEVPWLFPPLSSTVFYRSEPLLSICCYGQGASSQCSKVTGSGSVNSESHMICHPIH